MPDVSREDHLAWCKQRALEYVDRGQLQDAFTSLASDLAKHPHTANHLGMQLGMEMYMAGMLADVGAMRRFIKGFN
jgi:hypothetical protein